MDNSRKPPGQGQPGMTGDRQALADAQKYHQQRIRAQETGNQDQLAQIRQKLQAGGNPQAQQLTQTADTGAVDKGILATVPSLAGAPEMAGAAGVKALITRAAPMVGRILGQMGLKKTASALAKEAVSFGEGAAEKGAAKAASGAARRTKAPSMGGRGPGDFMSPRTRPTTGASKATGQTTPRVVARTRKPVTASKPAPKPASATKASATTRKVTDPRTVKPTGASKSKPLEYNREGHSASKPRGLPKDVLGPRSPSTGAPKAQAAPRTASGASLQRRAQALKRAPVAPKTAKPKTEAEPRTAADNREMMNKLKRSLAAAKKLKAKPK